MILGYAARHVAASQPRWAVDRGWQGSAPAVAGKESDRKKQASFSLAPPVSASSVITQFQGEQPLAGRSSQQLGTDMPCSQGVSQDQLLTGGADPGPSSEEPHP